MTDISADRNSQVEHFLKMEKKHIPDDINYDDVANLRKEARQKLNAIRPASLGQASRISGVSPRRCIGIDDLSGNKKIG